MSRGQLLLRVTGGVEGEGGRPDDGQAQPASGDDHLVAVGVAAVLLGPDVVLVEVNDLGAEGPVVAGAAPAAAADGDVASGIAR